MRKDFMYLASASPRRATLFEQIGVPYEVRPAEISERAHADEDAAGYVTRLACEKAERVWCEAANGESRPVLAADTAVVVDGRILGKPRDAQDALRMLAELSGRTHRVLTAVAVRDAQRRRSELCSSEVTFRTTTDGERQAYVATGEPLDKAGSYAIQGLGAVFVAHINGSYSGVMGLPLAETAALIAEFGLPRWLHDDEGSK